MVFTKNTRWRQRFSTALSRWTLASALGAAAISVCTFTEPLHAQAPNQAPPDEAGVNRTFLNKPHVHLPIEIDGNYRTQISSLVLYAKEGANGAWSLRDKAAPMQTSFTFKAPHDGEYWFRIVAIDNQGRSHPDDLAKDPQDAVVVIVDTTVPGLDIAYLGNAPEGQIIQCDTRDANPDLLKTRFYYQTRDQVWRSLEPLPDQPNVFCVPAQAALTNFIRIVATDLAGNSNARTLNLSELAVAAPKTAPRSPQPAAMQPPVMQPAMPAVAVAPPIMQQPATPQIAAAPPSMQPTPVATPIATVVTAPNVAVPSPIIVETTSSDEARSPLPQRINVISSTPIQTPPTPVVITNGPASGGPSLDTPPAIKSAPAAPSAIETTSGTMSKQTPPVAMQIVGNTQVYLNYAVENVGASGVGKMEIFATSDRGQSWKKVAEENQGKNPVQVNLPGEGTFGLKAVVSNGRGFGAQPPQAADPADWWVEVDTTKPKATITGIRPGGANEAGSVHIFWQAEDKNLNQDSVELYYAPSREGPWSPIGKNLKNNGQHRWQPPVEVGAHVFIRLLVRDTAGNIGLSETTQPVPLDDMSRPRIRLLTVTPSPATTFNSPSSIQPVQATSTPSEGNTPRIQPAQYTTSSMGVEVR